ncbi:hypothetical protein ES703_58888 [subsurface metagenome]
MGNRYLKRLKLQVACELAHRLPDNNHCLAGGFFFIIKVRPGDLLPDVGDLNLEGIEPGALGQVAESLLVKRRRAVGHHDAVQVFFLDGLFNHILTRLRAQVDVGLGINHPGNHFGLGGHTLHVHRFSDVKTAVADENTYPGSLHTSTFSLISLRIASSSIPNSFGSMPSASPMSWVK